MLEGVVIRNGMRKPTIVHSTGRNAVQVAVHMAGGHIYWCDAPSPMSPGGIHRIMADGTGLEHVVKDGIGVRGILGLTIDWIAGLDIFFLHT